MKMKPFSVHSVCYVLMFSIMHLVPSVGTRLPFWAWKHRRRKSLLSWKHLRKATYAYLHYNNRTYPVRRRLFRFFRCHYLFLLFCDYHSFMLGCGSASLQSDPKPYPDPVFHFNSDPDPAPLQSDRNLRPAVYRPSRLHFEPPGLKCERPRPFTALLYFEPLQLLNFDLNADPQPWPFMS
jgi:hypothetical protein